MATAVAHLESSPLVLHLGEVLSRMSDGEFFTFCQLNDPWRIERTAQGDLLIIAPTGGETGRRNFVLIDQFFAWSELNGSGVGFDSSTGFTLPNGAKRSPDLAWVTKERWEKLSTEEREEFQPLCPDFVAEIRSKSDDLKTLAEKMKEYMVNGARLGRLIDPIERRVHIYAADGRVTTLDQPREVSGEPVLPGFVLDARKVFAA